MRVLTTAIAPSHVLPMIPLGWALRAAGHDVLVVGGPGVTGTAQAAGLHTYPIGTEAAATPVTGGRVPAGELQRRWRDRVGAVIDEYLAFARGWAPDLILTDPMEFSAFLVGGVLGVPTVAHRWGPDVLTTRSRGPAREALESVCTRIGLADGLPEPVLTLDPCPPSLQSPLAAPARPVRFIPYNGAGGTPAPSPGSAPSRRVCISLGIFGGQMLEEHGASLLDAIMRAVAETPGTEAVLTVRPELRDRLTSVPPSVRLIDPTPLTVVLPYCDAVVHHGGTGTALTAVALGVPQLVLAQRHPGLTITGERVQAAGVGMTLDDPAEQTDPARVGAALRAVLDDPGYRQRTVAMRDQMHALPTPAALVPVLESLGDRPAGSAG